MKRFLFLLLALAALAALNCSSDSDMPCMTCPSEYLGGSCDIKDYKTIVINDKTWMAENLNCYVAGSKCYGNAAANCDKYGRLYDWATAMGISDSYNSGSYPANPNPNVKHNKGICPNGWHIPNNDEWTALITYVESNSGCTDYCAGKLLKATSGWDNNNGKSGNGTDAHHFSALPGGYGVSGNSFSYAGLYGYWWSAREVNSSSAYKLSMFYHKENTLYEGSGKSNLLSVRCMQD